ncbi:MAG TPA: hypothetical protein VNM45_16020 [Bacillus sp. (in: firmicutes)]|nr:hypothetical protein [Bacillus sp. (in: firmicutes)]
MQESINKACANAKKVVAYNHERYIALLATENKQKGIFEDFYVQIGQELKLFSFPSWINDSNPSFAPKIFYYEPNQYETDNRDLIVVALTTGTGSGFHQEEVHVFRRGYDHLVEYKVEDPIEAIKKTAATRLTTKQAAVEVGKVTSIIDIEWVGLTPEQIFDDVAWELMTHYQLEGDQLVAEVGGRVTLSHFIGEMKVTYCFKDGKYKVNSMQFHPIDHQALCSN